MGKQTSVSCPMTKDLLMKYTLVALCILAAVSYLSFGIASILICIISVVVAVFLDFLISMALKKTSNTASAAVCGLIVALCYSLGIPYSVEYSYPIMEGYTQYLFPALIGAVAVIVFKRLQGALERKYVNPAAAAKFLVLAFVWNRSYRPPDHLLPNFFSPPYFEGYMQMGYSSISTISNPTAPFKVAPFKDPLLTLTILKGHGWIGGASSIAVIIVGLALFALCRGYIKWRITLSYLVTVAVISSCLAYVYGDAQNILLRGAFHLFIGSVIFLAFFMATDPATTPITKLGQIIFAVGLGILTLVFQVYFLILGGSLIALVIMNLTTPILDRIGIPKPSEKRITLKLPKAKKFETAKLTNCIRCGVCLVSCCMNLSPILIEEAVDKENWVRVKNLKAEYCNACGYCSYVCPARIDLKEIITGAKQKIQEMPASAL